MKKLLGILLFVAMLSHPLSAKDLQEKSEVIAKLDGKPITKKEIVEYANRLGEVRKEYKDLLRTKEGLKKLVQYYIQRKLLLEEAKKKISKRDPIFLSHKSKFPEDTALLITYLTREVDGKVKITPQEVEKYMKEKGVPKEVAKRELFIEKRKELFFNLLERLKKLHKIEYLM